jgi:hypothetical protein
MGDIKRKNKPSLTKEEKQARQVLNADPLATTYHQS